MFSSHFVIERSNSLNVQSFTVIDIQTLYITTNGRLVMHKTVPVVNLILVWVLVESEDFLGATVSHGAS